MAAWRNLDLRDPISLQDKDDIADEIWGIGIRNLQEYESYFTAIEALLHRDAFGVDIFDPNEHIVNSYGQLVDLISYLKISRNVVRDPPLLGGLRAFWAGRYVRIPRTQGDDKKIFNSIELAIRIWLMLSFGTGGLSRRPGEPHYPWEQRDSINSLLTKMFPRSGAPETYLFNVPLFPQINGGAIVKGNDPPEPEFDRMFSDLFNLWDMKRLAGFQIKWTDNILSHLLVQKNSQRKFDTTVFIFHHAAVLRELDGRYPQSGIDFTQETLETLALLIPRENDECKYWYRLIVRGARERYHGVFNGIVRKTLPYLPAPLQRAWQLYHRFIARFAFVQNARRDDRYAIDPAAGTLHDASRRVCDYHYWRPRLLLLEKEFAESEPRDIFRWWQDRRKRREWATFWIAFFGFVFAILALILTLISTATGWESMRQAQRQNVIALSAARAANETSSNTCCAVACYGTITNGLVATPSCMSNTTQTTSQNSPSLVVVTITTSTFVSITALTTEQVTTTIIVSTNISS